MLPTRGYAALGPASKLAPFAFERRKPGPRDVLIEIAYCGICHSDIHQARDEWGGAIFPMVPGHEIVGRVTRVGTAVTRFKVGDLAGIGCLVDSCGACESCRAGEQQYCDAMPVWTYNAKDKRGTPTLGGYSNQIVVDEPFCLKMPVGLAPAGAAPLLCAGITTYSPLRHWGVGKGHTLAVVGLGGLGHMGVKFGKAFGAEVTVLSRSDDKKQDALRLGAADHQATGHPETFAKLARRFDFILDTVSAPHDFNAYLELLKTDGTMILVGAPPTPTPLSSFSLVLRRRRLVGSLIGGIRETQEMLDFCGRHGIVCDIETIPIRQVNEAYERVLNGDVRYRFVIDMSTL